MNAAILVVNKAAERGIMRKRRISIIILLVAFLFSAWGNVIAASFCPGYLARNCSLKHDARQTTQVAREFCHHDMAGMDMGDMKMDDMQIDEDSAQESEAPSIVETPPTVAVTESSIDQVTVEVPAGPCGHCWMHSQPSSATGTIAMVNPSQRSVEAIAPAAEMAVALGFPNRTATGPSEHSPPGNSLPRHVLINVFRI
jgi:hypothetical protein